VSLGLLGVGKAAGAAAALSYADAIAADSPVAHWRFGESSGATVADETVNNHDGTREQVGGGDGPTQGATGALAGDPDTAYTFDGAFQYVSVPHHADLAIVGDLTLEAWVKPADFANFNMLLCKGESAEYEWRLNQTTGLPALGTGYSYVIGTAAPAEDVWSHVAVKWVGTTITHYLNGVANGSGTLARPSAGSVALQIGSRSAGFFFKGDIDEPAIYASGLSDARILAHYEAGT
jgi:hypothetical protein